MQKSIFHFLTTSIIALFLGASYSSDCVIYEPGVSFVMFVSINCPKNEFLCIIRDFFVSFLSSRTHYCFPNRLDIRSVKPLARILLIQQRC